MIFLLLLCAHSSQNSSRVSDRRSPSTRESPAPYRALQLGWIGQYKWAVVRRSDAGSSFWVCTLFRLGLYLFRCKSALKECYVLSLCGGRQTGTRLLEEVSPVEIGALADCVSIISPVTDGSDIMRPHPSSLCSGKRTRVYDSAWWEHCSRRFSTTLEN